MATVVVMVVGSVWVVLARCDMLRQSLRYISEGKTVIEV